MMVIFSPVPNSINTTRETAALTARVANLEAALATAELERDAARKETDFLRQAHQALRLELELMKKRLFVAKAERIDVPQLELEFAEKLAQLDALSKRLEPLPPDMLVTPGAPAGGQGSKSKKPTGRRDVREAPIPEERLEVSDPALEGKARRVGFEESCKLAWRRGGFVRLVVARVKYETPEAATQVTTTAMPAELFPRLLAAPSLLAHIIVDKHCDSLPLHRQEARFARDVVPLDRGSMCRWLEDAGGTLGATIVEAARKYALATAFCISTDATGVSVQPIKGDMKKRQPCRRGHFFIQLADKDFAFFEYVPRETSVAVSELFKGFSGYVQADAKSVYDVLYRSSDEPPPDDEEERHEVGCWCHARRRFWESAIAKCAVSREALVRIQRIFENEQTWKGLAPAHVQTLRNERTRPLIDAFFVWVHAEYAKVKDTRGLLRSALGYAVRQQAALSRFLDDGRLLLDNNASERELRRVAVGRRAWLFVGSDDHAQAAANLFSLIASCKLHKLEPEAYLRDVLRILKQWPSDRYLELSPQFFAATRARLDPAELAREVGVLTIPPPLQIAVAPAP